MCFMYDTRRYCLRKWAKWAKRTWTRRNTRILAHFLGPLLPVMLKNWTRKVSP